MNKEHGLTPENLLRALPPALRNDEGMLALATPVAEILSKRPEEIDRIRIYPRIDELPEDLLDILAFDLKVDWWDPNYTLKEKRQTFKDSWRVHRHKGTKGAVRRAISAIYANTEVLEWFDYDGEPYRFKLIIDAIYEGVDPVRHQRIIDRIDYYKNLRSWLDGIEYSIYEPFEFAGNVYIHSMMSRQIEHNLSAVIDITMPPLDLEVEGAIYSSAGIMLNQTTRLSASLTI